MADGDQEAEQIEEILRLMRASRAGLRERRVEGWRTEDLKPAMDGAKTPPPTDAVSDRRDLRGRLADIENRLARLEERLDRAGLP
jgi:hypothetical protein